MEALHRAGYGRRGMELWCPLWVYHFPSTSMVHQPGMPPSRLSCRDFYGGIIMWPWLLKWVTINHGLHFQSLSCSPVVRRWGYKFQPSDHAWVFLATSPHPETFLEACQSLIRMKVDPTAWEIPRDLGALCRNWGQRPNKYFFLYHSIIVPSQRIYNHASVKQIWSAWLCFIKHLLSSLYRETHLLCLLTSYRTVTLIGHSFCISFMGLSFSNWVLTSPLFGPVCCTTAHRSQVGLRRQVGL